MVTKPEGIAVDTCGEHPQLDVNIVPNTFNDNALVVCVQQGRMASASRPCGVDAPSWYVID
jgi:hypothetical protein